MYYCNTVKSALLLLFLKKSIYRIVKCEYCLWMRRKAAGLYCTYSALCVNIYIYMCDNAGIIYALILSYVLLQLVHKQF